MSEKLIINQVSIRRKGLDPKTYSLPSITDILTDGSVKSNHIDWTSVASYLDKYVTKAAHLADIDIVIGQIPNLQIDELTLNLKYDNLYFLNVNNCPEDLSDDISALNTAIENILNDITEINTAINSLEDNDTNEFLELKDITNDNGYIAIAESENSTKYLELLTDKLINLLAIAEGGGTVYVTPKVEKGGKAILIAEPDQDKVFQYWSYGATNISTNAIHILTNVLSNATYLGHFGSPDQSDDTQLYTLTIHLPEGGYITATIAGELDNIGYELAVSLDEGTVINLIASPSATFRFNGWTSGVPLANVNNATTSITLNANTEVSAQFVKQLYMVEFGADDNTHGSVTAKKVINGSAGDSITSEQLVDAGTKIRLFPSPSNGYQFSSWTVADNAGTVDSNNEIIVNSNLTITANFTEVSKGTIWFGYRDTTDFNEFDSNTVVVLRNQQNLTNPYYMNDGEVLGVSSLSVPNTSYVFSHFEDSDGETIDSESGQLNIVGGETYYCVFAIKCQINATAGEHGSVTGGGEFDQYSTCTLIATPENSNYRVEGWYTVINNIETKILNLTETEYSFVVNTSVNIKVKFTIKTFNVKVQASPTTGGNVSLDANSTVTESTVNINSKPTLYATASTGYEFKGWKIGTGNIISGSNVYAYTVTNGVTTNTTYTAVFTKLYTINVLVPSNLSTIGSAKIVSGTTAPTTSSGSSVTITSGTQFTAKAFINSAQQAAYSFDKWTNNVDSTTNTNVQFSGTATKDITYTASFKINQVTITVSASPTNGGTVDPTSETLDYGSSLTIRAYPNDGFNFIKWLKDGVDIEGGLQLQLSNITSGANYTAIFEQEAAPLYYYYTSELENDTTPGNRTLTPFELNLEINVENTLTFVILVPQSVTISSIKANRPGPTATDVTSDFRTTSVSINNVAYTEYYLTAQVDEFGIYAALNNVYTVS